MAGVTKRKYNNELMIFSKSLKRPLNLIQSVLPFDYNEQDVLRLFKELYPFEWQTIKQRYDVYKKKDDFLLKSGKKRRYFPKTPKTYLLSLSKVKHMLSKGQKENHNKYFDLEKCVENYKKLRG